MMRWIARIAVGRAAKITVGLMLAVGGLAALPAVSASAGSSVEAWWTPTGGGSVYPKPYPCTAYQYEVQGKPVQVDNNCGTRVWLHYYDTGNGQIYAYCVDPGGGVAYDFNYPSSDIQVSSNSSQCDSGATFVIYWHSDNSTYVEDHSYGCNVGTVETMTGYFIASAYNGCNTRMWLHEYDNGTGNSLCMNTGVTTGPYSVAYWQVQVSYNETACSAGGPPE